MNWEESRRLSIVRAPIPITAPQTNFIAAYLLEIFRPFIVYTSSFGEYLRFSSPSVYFISQLLTVESDGILYFLANCRIGIPSSRYNSIYLSSSSMVCLLFERTKTPPKVFSLFTVSTLGGAYQAIILYRYKL